MIGTLQERLAAKHTSPLSGCWEWVAARMPNGYGLFSWKESGRSRSMVAHKAVYELLVGQVPEGLELDHTCRNRSCVNPNHLEPVTPRVNTLRSNGPAAVNAAKTHCKQGHPLVPQNIYSPPSRPTERVCRICKAQRNQRKIKTR